MDAMQMITFVKDLERLKETTRSAYMKSGRRESVAEHSWRLAMFALVLKDHFPELNMSRVISMCLVHDLGEAYDGDVSATIKVNQQEKIRKEEEAVKRLTSTMALTNRNSILTLCKEYNKGITNEAKFVKALDKIETIIQHTQGKNPPGFDYTFNLTYGREYADHHPILKSLREEIDKETQKRIDENT
ncbi:HD domain-containing protein [Guptibacillus hwajinpoensis]|uniref:5'-deoxynucleotidase n=1 Tax=Guptibacillus hwajinpoensis TaxID=208199 RepID=A0A0J6D137_9BACL|nr:HD domain-containing protein [Alkalihalobacillus macyae]KMM39065.1 phosphohydrolase [Alkalihalobacillus macyae]